LTSDGGEPQAKRMSRSTAAVGSVMFFVAAPGVVAGLLPWWLTHWHARRGYELPLRIAGATLLLCGLVTLAIAFVDFVTHGIGTPAPVAPTRHLVITGPYRYVRNPMYLAVLAAIIGQGLALGQPSLFPYAAIVAAAAGAFVLIYEEPTLQQRFGAQYAAYKRAVPRWCPRRRPWTPNTPPPITGPDQQPT
jgi:protein-S-isoprenylcysteine O-methyltransferase Ste14